MTACGYNDHCGRWHVLGCPGHPFNPEYGRLFDPEQLKQARIDCTRNMYAAGAIDAETMDRRIECAVRGDQLEVSDYEELTRP